MDAGFYESTPFFFAGAHIVTVLGASDPGTIKGVVQAAAYHKGAMAQVDLISIDNKIEKALLAEDLGAHIVGIHTGLDAQSIGQTPFKTLNDIVRLKLSIKISIAGGITKHTVCRAIDSGADIVVCGAAIYDSPDPLKAAIEIREAVERG